MTTLHDFGGVLGRHLDTFSWALTICMVTGIGSCVKWPLEVRGKVAYLLSLKLQGIPHWDLQKLS